MPVIHTDYIKANPSGNTTIFVLQPFARRQHGKIAVELMKETVIAAEQVGYLETPENPAAIARLQMMGGEFCGNAARSFAAWLAMGGEDYIKNGGPLLRPLKKDCEITIEVSGNAGLLTAKVEKTELPYGCYTEISMLAPRFLLEGMHNALGAYTIMGLEGITHIVLWDAQPDAKWLSIVRDLFIDNGLDTDCFGLMFVIKRDPVFIRPLVYVESVGSLVWEQSCGSGSLSTALAIAAKTGNRLNRFPIQQPGGTLYISILPDKNIYTLSGPVMFTAYGTAWAQYEKE